MDFIGVVITFMRLNSFLWLSLCCVLNIRILVVFSSATGIQRNVLRNIR